MIGFDFDDIYDCYLPTEIDTNIDENVEKFNDSNLNEAKKQNSIRYIECIAEEEEEEIEETQIEPVEMAPFSEIPKLDEPFVEPSKHFPTETSEIYFDAIEKFTTPILTEKDNFDVSESDGALIVTVEPPESDNPQDLSIEIDPASQNICNEPPCSIELTAPDYSQLLNEQRSAVNSEYFIDESQVSDEFCRICNNRANESSDPDDWIICYGCGEAFHRKCLQGSNNRIKCELPLIYRRRICDPEEGRKGIFSHAPWFCNSCVTCSTCPCKNNDVFENEDLKQEAQNLKNSFVCCRHCGKVSCLICYNSESISNGSIELGKFENLKNYCCSGCLRCINCGLNATSTDVPVFNRRKSISNGNIKTSSVLLYDDFTLCRPCYLSNQSCATCPRCKQVYHSLTDGYDFGDAPYNSEFSLCPMVSCDECGSWTHCQCEGIDEEEYERLGADSDSKFYCVNCKINSKRQKKNQRTDLKIKNIFRRGNFMCPDESEEDSILFKFWSLEESWKRTIYELNFMKRHFTICGPKKLKIEASSLEKLSQKLMEKFQTGGENNFCKAVKPERVLSPMNLLNFLESAKKHEEFCDYLRAEIAKMDIPASSRTQPIDRVIDKHVKNSISRRRCLSILDLPTNIKSVSCDLSGGYPTPPTTTASSGKMTVKFLYMQYLQAIRSDSSIRTVDAISQGLALRPSAISGFGLFALRPFQKNSLIIEYCGEMLTGEDLVNKRDAYYNLLGKRYQQSCYLFRLDELKVLDATHKGNLSRFINHSCDPNCYSRVVQIDGQKKLLIFASKSIEAGEEILYDYKFPDEEQKIPCLCGSEKCRKWMN